VLVCFPGYSGEFDRAADAGQLARSLACFSKALSFGYAYSAASTVHKLIERSQGRGNPLGPGVTAPEGGALFGEQERLALQAFCRSETSLGELLALVPKRGFKMTRYAKKQSGHTRR
jgi:hypothetical protein